jgi:hypothetical protein
MPPRSVFRIGKQRADSLLRVQPARIENPLYLAVNLFLFAKRAPELNVRAKYTTTEQPSNINGGLSQPMAR